MTLADALTYVAETFADIASPVCAFWSVEDDVPAETVAAVPMSDGTYAYVWRVPETGELYGEL